MSDRVIITLAVAPLAQGRTTTVSDETLRQQMIHESIEAYSGNCPCPYNTARNGSRCGKRSAHSRPGGEAPLCYASDITPAAVRAYRDRHKAPTATHDDVAP